MIDKIRYEDGGLPTGKYRFMFRLKYVYSVEITHGLYEQLFVFHRDTLENVVSICGFDSNRILILN